MKSFAPFPLWKTDGVAWLALDGRLRETYGVEPLPPDFMALAEALAAAFVRHHTTVAGEPGPLLPPLPRRLQAAAESC